MTELTRKIEEPEQMSLYPTGAGDLGNILINPDVIARIAGMAAVEIDGVSLGSKFTLADILPGKEPVRGIAVTQNDEGRYAIVCEVKMAYRTPMRETALKLQRHVKETVERMAGLELDSVDVKIVDIYVEKRERENSAPVPAEEETPEN